MTADSKPRQCIGNTFALMELVLVVSTIAQRCQLDREPGDEGPGALDYSPSSKTYQDARESASASARLK